MTGNKVTMPQFFSLLYLSTLSSAFMYISSPKVTVASTDSLLRPLVFTAVSIASVIPAFILIKQQNKLTPEKRQEMINGKLYKGVALIYAVIYFIDALMTTARFDLFASSELFPGTDMTFFIIGLVAICAFLAILNIGALVRASVIFTFIVVGATLFAAISLVKQVDLLNFTPIFENGIGGFFTESLYFCIQASEIGTVLLFVPQISGNIKKGYIWWTLLSAASFSFILFFVVGTLGAFADTQLFPTYAAVSLAEFGLLERLDAIETAIWILCIVVKLSFYIVIVIKSIRFTFKKISAKVVSFICAAAVSAVIAFVSVDITRFDFISQELINIIIFTVPVLLLPIVLLIYTIIKRRQKSEKSL